MSYSNNRMNVKLELSEKNNKPQRSRINGVFGSKIILPPCTLCPPWLNSYFSDSPNAYFYVGNRIRQNTRD